jgi:hypothetical protein
VTLDEQIRSDLRQAASTVDWVPPTNTDEIRRRGRHRLIRRRVIWVVGSVVVALPVLAITLSFDPNRISPADTEDVAVVEIADLSVAVQDPDPVLTDPDVWMGLPGPAPLFDTSDLGPDLSFTPGEPAAGDLDERNMRNDGWPTAIRAVYLGALDGEPFYLYSAPAPSVWDTIFEIVGGNFSGDVMGTTLSCCSGGDMDHVEGLPGVGHSKTGTTELTHTEWLGLPTDVSVVAYRIDDEPYGWQTPVGGVSSLALDEYPREFEMVAFDTSGREIERFGPIELEPVPGDAVVETVPQNVTVIEDWAPGPDGTEIQVEDLSASLAEAIEPQAADRFFSIAVDGGEVVILVRGTTTHAYAETCEALASLDLPPGMGGTCLD